MPCRHCGTPTKLVFADLGSAPPSNAYLTQEKLSEPEQHYPLRVLVCENCWLAQTEDFASREELFEPEYAYFSGFSTTWLKHCQTHVENLVRRFNLSESSFFVELASNDGYLLQYVKALGIPCLGVEPTRAPAEAARAKGISVVQDFFGEQLGESLRSQYRPANVIVANNVLAHVPDINDFVRGIGKLLARDGVATLEFPHILKLVEESQFDTIYHEHYSYLSATAVQRIFREASLELFDIEELPTHGGSLRVYAKRAESDLHPIQPSVPTLIQQEADKGVSTPSFYADFSGKVQQVKNELTSFIRSLRDEQQTIAAYGAAAKGNTLLNYAGLSVDDIPFVVDLNVHKQGKFLPGSRLPIVSEDRLKSEKPDFVLILPWNLREEIVEQLDYVREWGGKFVTSIPRLEIF